MNTRRHLLALAVFVVATPPSFAQTGVPLAPELVESQLIENTSIPTNSEFGKAFDVANGRLVVGAPKAPGFVSGSSNGSVFVYERDGAGQWNEVQRLLAPSWAKSFGTDVDIDRFGERLVIGSALTGAWVFDRQPNGTWVEAAWLGEVPNPGGARVSVDGDVVVTTRNQTVFNATPGITAFERQGGGTWVAAPFTTTGSQNSPWEPSTHLFVDGDVILEVSNSTLFNCDQLLNGTLGVTGNARTRGYVRTPTGWESLPQMNLALPYSNPAVDIDNGIVVLGLWSANELDPFNCWLQVSPCLTCSGTTGFVRGWDPNLPATSSQVFSVGFGTSGPGLAAFSGGAEEDFGTRVAMRNDRLALVTSTSLNTHHLLVYRVDTTASPSWARVQLIARHTIGLLPLIRTEARQYFVRDAQRIRVFDEPSLIAVPGVASLSLATDAEFTLRAGSEWAGDPYMLLGSASGTMPGIPLEGGVTIPLVVDGYTQFTLGGAPHIVGQTGVLDASGAATARLDLPSGLWPGLAGLSVHHAFLCADLTTFEVFASNAVPTYLLN